MTSLVGIYKVKDPLTALKTLYKQQHEKLQTIPDCVYKNATQALIKKQEMIVQKYGEDVEAVEKEIDLGSIEEVIMQNKDELRLIDVMKEYKVWENLEEKPPIGNQGKCSIRLLKGICGSFYIIKNGTKISTGQWQGLDESKAPPEKA